MPIVVSSAGSSRRTFGWIAFGAGGALLTGAAVVLWMRHEDIASLNRSCPAGACPPGTNPASLESTRNRALAEGPAGVALGAGAAVAAALGTYLVVTARTPSAADQSNLLTPTIGPSGVGALWRRAF
jgi:hypothetical protein